MSEEVSKNFENITRNFQENFVRKIYKTSGEVSKNFENITRNFEENFEKTKSKFWKNFLGKKMYFKSKLIPNSPFAPNRASLSRLPIASYLTLVYIRATARAIREETIFADSSSGRLPIYAQKW